MYTCNRCRLDFQSNPARVTGKNYALKFCATCSEDMTRRTVQKSKDYAAHVAAANKCKWCNSSLNEENRSTRSSRHSKSGHQYNSNLCVECDAHSSNRKWLERCLTNSDTILNFIDNPRRRKQWKQTREEKCYRETLPLMIRWEQAAESQAAPQNNTALTSLLQQLLDALNAAK